MGAMNRLMRLAQVIGLVVIATFLAGAGMVAYLWFDSRQSTPDHDVETGVETESTDVQTEDEPTAE